MRPRLPLLLAAALAGCTAAAPPAPAPREAIVATPYALTIEEEATILRLEDRREFDPALASAWIAHPNATHRRRMALALGRIGPATFADENGNGVKDEGELMAGVRLLIPLVADPTHEVREAAAFALGEIGDPAGIEALLGLAADQQHAGVAAEALEALSKMGSSVPFERYAPYASPGLAEGIRARAVRFLFRFENPEASMLAATYLADGDGTIRREAAYSLSRRPDPAGRDRLHLLLTDPDVLTRAYAARALGRIGDAASIEPLLDILQDGHPWVRINALVALGQLAEKNPAALGNAPFEKVGGILTLLRDPDPGARTSAIDTAAMLARSDGTARARLLELASEGAPWQREAASAAFIRHFGASDAATAAALLQTDSRFQKIRAAEASSGIGENGAEIRTRLLGDADASVRAAALGAIPDPELASRAEEIAAALSDSDPIVRASAIERYAATASVPPAEKMDALRRELAKGDSDELNDARVAAVTAIAALELPERIEILRPLVSHRDPVVRRLAAEGLAKAGEPRPQYTPLPIERPISEYETIARWALENHTALLRTGRGDIQVLLLTRDAPMTAWNFAQLAARDYFDGTTFMRVVPNFVVQGGDPRNDQSGGPGYSIRDEINLQKYTRGAVGMALSGPDTGGSQFFITHSPQPHLDGGYTIFGRVIGGMSGVVDQIERGDRVNDVIIDEGVVTEVDQRVSAVEKPPLPLEIGPMTAEHLVERLPEYAERKAAFEPDPAVVEAIAMSVQPGDRLEVVLGTWCSDSQREVPKLLKISDLIEAQYGVTLPISYVAVSRAKSEPAELVAGRNIEKVATFIYYRDDAELGRIVETPEGPFEDHLMRIAATP
jgi:cyclophilin family peptidyl-prolyl cis-trans isomerase